MSKLRPTGEVELGPLGKWQGEGWVLGDRGKGVQRPSADRRSVQGVTTKGRSQATKGFASQAKETGLSPGTVGWLQVVSRGVSRFRKITPPAPVGGSGIGGVARREGGDGVKEGDGFTGWSQTRAGMVAGRCLGRLGRRLGEAEPLPIAVSRRGASLPPPHQHSLHSPGLSPAAPGNIPLERP